MAVAAEPEDLGFDEHGIPRVDLSREWIDKRVVAWLDCAFAQAHRVLALQRLGHYTEVAFADPRQARRLEGPLLAAVGPVVSVVRASGRDISKAIDARYGDPPSWARVPSGPEERESVVADCAEREATSHEDVPRWLGIPPPEEPEERVPCSFCGGERRPDTLAPRFVLGGAICEACVEELHARRPSARLDPAVAAQLVGELEPLHDEHGFHFLDLARFGADERVVPWIDRSFAEANRLIALQQGHVHTTVAFADPRQLPALKPRLLAQVGPRITPVRATEDDILRAIARYYPD